MNTRSALDTPLRLRIRWPAPVPDGQCDNFFVGAWHPSRSIAIDWTDSSNNKLSIARLSGRNWFLASATAPRNGAGLVHRTDSGGGIAFRGYVLPDVHSYSQSAAIHKCWLDTTSARNGVFSAAVIGRDGASLTLATDLLGMGTLYWRRLGEIVLFATNPRYLACPDDEPDRLAWRYLVQTSWIGADRSLTAGIGRVPAGCAMTFAGGGEPVTSPPAWRLLPEGGKRIDSQTLDEVEHAFQQSLDRCLRLRSGSVMLPLSSGFDSRRILAGLVRRKTGFTAVTCRVLQQGNRDLDARFARQMAQDFGFPHRVVDATDRQYQSDDVSRRALTDSETGYHTWACRVFSTLPDACEVIFDGIGGDILGDPVGWRATIGLGLATGDRTDEEEIKSIAVYAIKSDFDGVLAPARWPTAENLRDDLRGYLRTLRPRANLGELAFLLLRQRRAIALWSQQLPPPGVVPLYPYLDADYLRVVLALSSEDKNTTKLQRACLNKFFPEFLRYGGNRDIPSDMPLGSPDRELGRRLRCLEQLRLELEQAGATAEVRELLALKGRLALAVSGPMPALALRWSWYLQPLMELVSQQARRIPVWDLMGAP